MSVSVGLAAAKLDRAKTGPWLKNLIGESGGDGVQKQHALQCESTAII